MKNKDDGKTKNKILHSNYGSKESSPQGELDKEIEKFKYMQKKALHDREQANNWRDRFTRFSYGPRAVSPNRLLKTPVSKYTPGSRTS